MQGGSDSESDAGELQVLSDLLDFKLSRYSAYKAASGHTARGESNDPFDVRRWMLGSADYFWTNADIFNDQDPGMEGKDDKSVEMKVKRPPGRPPKKPKVEDHKPIKQPQRQILQPDLCALVPAYLHATKKALRRKEALNFDKQVLDEVLLNRQVLHELLLSSDDKMAESLERLLAANQKNFEDYQAAMVSREAFSGAVKAYQKKCLNLEELQSSLDTKLSFAIKKMQIEECPPNELFEQQNINYLLKNTLRMLVMHSDYDWMQESSWRSYLLEVL